MADKAKVTPIDDEELQVAKEAAESAAPTFKLTLKKPFTYNGTEYTELDFDFESTTGADCIAIERELSRKNINVIVPAFSVEYIIRFAARACLQPIGSDAMSLLSSRDYSRVRGAVRNFLANAESA